MTKEELINRMFEDFKRLKSLALDYYEAVIHLRRDLYEGDMEHLETLSIYDCWEDMVCNIESIIDAKKKIIEMDNENKNAGGS